MDGFLFAGAEGHALKACQPPAGPRSGSAVRAEVELHYFFTRDGAGVFHFDSNLRGVARFELRGKAQLAIRKGSVTQSEAERIERVSFKVPVSPAFHRIVGEGRNLVHRLL